MTGRTSPKERSSAWYFERGSFKISTAIPVILSGWGRVLTSHALYEVLTAGSTRTT